MHQDEIDVSVELVRQLLADQFRQWHRLPITRVASPGTDNAIFRLGSDLAARLPRIQWAAATPEREFRWVGHVAPHLPIAVSVPLALGKPGRGYPWGWTVTPWLPGLSAYDDPLTDLDRAAADLADVIAALQSVDAHGELPPDAPRASRGYPIRQRDAEVRNAVEKLGREVDGPAVLRAWEEVLEAPDWDASPVWIHGDLQQTNLIVQRDRLSGVLDFGGLGVGDPAADLIPAWSLFDGRSRALFRERLGVDEATWVRGRGWALSVGLVALPYYLHTNPVIVDWSTQSIEAVLTG